ncbi:MAG: hypothetical protein J3Q66DRAFT_351537 [Benniella sp.]|nr:MAG: hypothetical protein J3Q66DRAFT_351537 [Benniella sp.]
MAGGSLASEMLLWLLDKRVSSLPVSGTFDFHPRLIRRKVTARCEIASRNCAVLTGRPLPANLVHPQRGCTVWDPDS